MITRPGITTDEFLILDALAWHRYLTLGQVKRLVCPWDVSKGYAGKTYDTLKALKRRGYTDSGQIDARGVHIWFVTPKGLAVVPQKRRRDYVPSQAMAVGSDAKHSYCVNEVSIAFAKAARERDDEDAVFALEHERLLRPGTDATKVTADGILQYTGMGLTGKNSLDVAWAIVEVDRTTQFGRIANRLRAYGEIRRKPSLWKKVLPDDWPPVLFVLAAEYRPRPRVGERNWTGDPRRAQTRCDRLVAYMGEIAREPSLRGLDMLFCSLPALIAQGPFAPIWHRPGHPEGLDWCGKPAIHLLPRQIRA